MVLQDIYNLDEVYKFRSVLSKLYNNDCIMNGDLNYDLLTIKESNDIIEEVDIDLQIGKVKFKLNKTNLNHSQIDNILISIKNIIVNFINNNISNININKNDFNRFINFVNNCNLLYETMIINDMIIILL